MDRKSDLRKRITGGERTIVHLTQLGQQLPPGKKRDEISDRVTRLLSRLACLKDAFTAAFPGKCLYTEADCNEPNKGLFPCARCVCFMNAIYQKEEVPDARFRRNDAQGKAGMAGVPRLPL